VNLPIISDGRVDRLPAAGGWRAAGTKSEKCAAFSAGALTAPNQFYMFGMMKSKDVIGSLAALAQESRLTVFRMLVRRGPEGYTPTQLAEKLKVPAPTLSFHLKELQRAGLVAVRRDGRFLYYRPNFARMKQLMGFLTENCCVLAEQGCDPECAPVATEVSLTRKRRA
jgi:ArsR family transcriptional regulator, arsenate/arsenite/antimonite-responsive transcriptional repressor